MTSSEQFAAGSLGIFGIFLFIFGVVYAILMIALPFVVYGILRQTRLLSTVLARVVNILEHRQREEEKRAAAAAFQSELTVAALQRIKDSSDALLTHSQYQTDVTKHRLALETTTQPGELPPA